MPISIDNGRDGVEGSAPASTVRRSRPLGPCFLLLLVLFGAAAAVATVYVSVQSQRDARNDATDDARFAARTAAGELAKDVATLRATVAGLAANPVIAQTLE